MSSPVYANIQGREVTREVTIKNNLRKVNVRIPLHEAYTGNYQASTINYLTFSNASNINMRITNKHLSHNILTFTIDGVHQIPLFYKNRKTYTRLTPCTINILCKKRVRTYNSRKRRYEYVNKYHYDKLKFNICLKFNQPMTEKIKLTKISPSAKVTDRINLKRHKAYKLYLDVTPGRNCGFVKIRCSNKNFQVFVNGHTPIRNPNNSRYPNIIQAEKIRYLSVLPVGKRGLKGSISIQYGENYSRTKLIKLRTK